MTTPPPSDAPTPARRAYVPAVGPRLRRLLALVLLLFALLSVNGIFLVGVRVAGLWTGANYENLFYLYNFLVHLVLGLVLLVPAVVFGVLHIRNAKDRPNRRAVRVGYALFAATLLLLGSGVVLTRIEGLVVLGGQSREIAYWCHVLMPLAVVWLFILHRLAGRRIKWKVGLRWAGIAALFAGGSLLLMTRDPRQWNVVGNAEGDRYFRPSLARTVSGDFIPESVLANDQYCLECHADVHASWSRSMHKFASFNNPAYLASIRATRKAMLDRDGDVRGARFCAGCHDPVPFFSGKFNDPNYDDVNDSSAGAGITCTVCHGITHVNSVRGNADYTIDEPLHYPFATSDNPVLAWVNRQLIRAKPAFHKQVFLKPLHRTPEFCGTCHKVHLPKELNRYKWLRGQNHFDAYHTSGVSGHGIQSFYYPPKAEHNCNGCHMPTEPSTDLGSRVLDASGVAKVHSHLFPSANTGVPHLLAEAGKMDPGVAAETIRAHREFNRGVMRVDLFGVRGKGRIDGALTAPLRPAVPVLTPGETYLLEAVIRTVKMGHLFTEGTADSNQVWLDVKVTAAGKVIGRSGGVNRTTGQVDPYAHFVNAFVLDRHGNRIARRNAEDIFVALYNHQIPPGAADAIHFRLQVPADVVGPVRVDVALRYRKFDTEYLRFVKGDPNAVNDLPVMTLATDSMQFATAGTPEPASTPHPVAAWERWNDYGIGLLRKPGTGQLRQAEEAFAQVEALGRADGPLNLARVYLREGRIAVEAPDALRRARDANPPAPEWSLLWFAGRAARMNGDLDAAIQSFQQILDGGFAQAAGRGFDFSEDYNLRNQLASTLFDRARQERGAARRGQRRAFVLRAEEQYKAVLGLDPENVAAHYGLQQVYSELGDEESRARHRVAHERYRVDDQARDTAITAARRKYPAADRAAESVVIYDLMRKTTFDADLEQIGK